MFIICRYNQIINYWFEVVNLKINLIPEFYFRAVWSRKKHFRTEESRDTNKCKEQLVLTHAWLLLWLNFNVAIE